MELYLVRHAVAVAREQDFAEPDRPLTAEGTASFEAVVGGLKNLGIKLDRVYHSPWLRAIQTAELLSPLLQGESVVHAGLIATPGPELLADLQGEQVALVGHRPWLNELLALMVTGNPDLGEHFVLKKGGIAHLSGEVVPGGMSLLALLTPKVLRRHD